MNYEQLLDSPFQRIAAYALRKVNRYRCLGEMSKCAWETTWPEPLKIADVCYTGDAANLESDRRAAAFDVSKKALAEIKRRLKDGAKGVGVKVKRAPTQQFCAHCRAILTAA